MKPTERTLKYFRDRGYICDMVERWIRNPKHPAGGFRKDYLGFGDILGFNEIETVLIQSCGSDFAAHIKKIFDLPEKDFRSHPARWLADPNRRLIVMGWRKVKKKRGGKLKIFKPRLAEFYNINGELDCRETKDP